MTEPRQIETAVVIVGGGPVGLGLAATLGKAGIGCVLLERCVEPSAIPKGQNLTARSSEHFYFWGCAEELHAARVLPPEFPIGGITTYESLASEYWYAPAGREAVGDFYYQQHERLPQYLTEAVLRRHVGRIGSVLTMFGWSAEEVEIRDDGVRVRAREDVSGARCEIRGAYVVGCDGAHSSVRAQVGITCSGVDFDQRMVLAVFSSRDLQSTLDRFPARTTYRALDPELEGYWWFFGRVDATETWFFHAPVPRGSDATTLDVHALVQRAAGVPVDCSFEYIGFWDLRVDIADTYRVGRAFLAGDAAHSHPPYGAYGLNTGLEDAVNLGWKMAAVLEKWAEPRLLDTYSEERRPIFVETGEAIAEGIAKDRAFLAEYSPHRDRRAFERAWNNLTSGDTAPPSYEPHYEGSSIVWGRASSGCGVHGAHTFTARAGHHLAPVVLSSGRNIFEELGSGYTLVALSESPVVAVELEKAATSLRVPLRVVVDTFEEEREAYGCPLILVRPDQYVAWAGDELPSAATTLLRRAVGGVV